MALLRVNSFNRKVNKVQSLNIKVYKIARAGKCWNKVIISSPQWASVRPFKIGVIDLVSCYSNPQKDRCESCEVYHDLLWFTTIFSIVNFTIISLYPFSSDFTSITSNLPSFNHVIYAFWRELLQKSLGKPGWRSAIGRSCAEFLQWLESAGSMGY